MLYEKRWERNHRVLRLVQGPREMSPRAAATVVDAAMFGIGCTEGTVREEIQKRLDREDPAEVN